MTVNLNDPRIRVSVETPRRGVGHAETMSRFIKRTQPSAAITGTFFDTRSLLPVGDIVTRGRTLYRGPAGTGFCVRADNTVDFTPRHWGRSYDWSDYRTVLCTGPTLLRKGRKALYPHAEGYRDPALWALRPRTAVGRTRNNKLLLVCVTKPIHLSSMLYIMRQLGAKDAVGLDGGSSCALYANGKAIVRPGRALTNMLVVYRSRKASPTVVARLDREREVRLAAYHAKHHKPYLPSAVVTTIATIGAR